MRLVRFFTLLLTMGSVIGWLLGIYISQSFIVNMLLGITSAGILIIRFWSLFKQLSTSRNERLLSSLQTVVTTINQLEPEWQVLSDDALQAKTKLFKEKIVKGATLESLIPEVFATVREVSRRTLNMRHFDVQLIGGLVLDKGKIAEMRTGEGKTLVATMPIYLNALMGKGVHLVTVNDYLAKRDAEWMKPIYQFLGLSVGIIQAGMTPFERRRAYAADITYGTNNEFGFDYLRDNMVLSAEEKVQRGLYYALVDEVDSILIDEARTPLIISGPSEEDLRHFSLVNQIVSRFKQGATFDFTVDEKARQVYLTEAGYQNLEKQLVQVGLLKPEDNPYSTDHANLMYHVSAALQAYYVFRRDVDYIVQSNQIIIVDEHTGRLMQGRRWGGGVHQALEAKEGLTVQPENQTLARITFQNYFRLYQKLAGMTGTADTEAYELQKIYGLEVIVIPTDQPIRRKDLPDKIYLSLAEKWEAIVLAVEACWKREQPILVGTASIEHSEFLSGLLQRRSIPHQVLNAKRHEQEARIIAEAGRPRSVTIATNMAGRGTDIVLGGNLQVELAEIQPQSETVAQHQKAWRARYEAVVKAGGLHIIGSSRHESRRIDNQLRGRSGRQGDPGSSQFYLSLEDDLLRIFAGDRLSTLMQRLGMKQGESIEHAWVSNAIQNAQRKVEEHQFDIRKDLLEYDDVMNEQRKIVYGQRTEILEADALGNMLDPLWREVLTHVVEQHTRDGNIETLLDTLRTDFCISFSSIEQLLDLHKQGLLSTKIAAEAANAYHVKHAQLHVDQANKLQKMVVLEALDNFWKEHLGIMDRLRQQVRLRGFAQQNPKEEYKREAFELFKQFIQLWKYTVISRLSCVDIHQLSEVMPSNNIVQRDPGYQMISRNSACPCKSGKKFKHCHGRLD